MSLYVLATPIGNMGDLSQRAIQTLTDCDIVACEDTRVASKLMGKLNLHKEFILYSDIRENINAQYLLEKLQSGKSVVLISDAGTPCISDPGFRIVRLCRQHNIDVIPIPGACAFVAAMSASGLPSNAILFLGFLPPKTSARKACFQKYLDFEHTLIFYESVHRIDKFIDDACEIFGGDRVVCVAKELTKIYEKFFVGTLSDVKNQMKSVAIKGEFVVIIAPKDFLL